MRWISQISEFWPLEEIAKLEKNEDERMRALTLFVEGQGRRTLETSRHDLGFGDLVTELPITKKGGRIFLLGSGTGSPALLPVITHHLLTSGAASLILSDKLVPKEILDLIPKDKGIQVVIAKKFPGNSEGAQSELMELAVKGAEEGKVVVRVSKVSKSNPLI
jgi:uroporphyrin-III C-methyltransferase